MLLDWVAPSECPSERDVVAHVTSLAGETVTSQPLRVWARVVRLPDSGPAPSDGPTRWRLDLRIGREDEAPRVLESSECRKLAEAAAFIVALDLQSRAEAKERGEVPPPAPPATLAPAVPPPMTVGGAPSVVPAPYPPAPPKRRLHGGLGAEFGADLGTLPAFAWGGGFFGWMSHGSFRGELGVTLWPESRATVTFPRGAGASVSLREGSARGCWTPGVLPIFDACLRLEGGVTHAAGFGIRRSVTSNAAWFAGLAGITARPFEAGPFRPRLTVELGTPFVYSDVLIAGIGNLHTPGPLLFRFSLGLETKLF